MTRSWRSSVADAAADFLSSAEHSTHSHRVLFESSATAAATGLPGDRCSRKHARTIRTGVGATKRGRGSMTTLEVEWESKAIGDSGVIMTGCGYMI